MHCRSRSSPSTPCTGNMPTAPRGTTGSVTPRHRASLAALKDPDPRFGPLVRQGDRVWTLFGRGPADPARDLVELVPK